MAKRTKSSLEMKSKVSQLCARPVVILEAKYTFRNVKCRQCSSDSSVHNAGIHLETRRSSLAHLFTKILCIKVVKVTEHTLPEARFNRTGCRMD